MEHCFIKVFKNTLSFYIASCNPLLGIQANRVEGRPSELKSIDIILHKSRTNESWAAFNYY